MMRVLHRTTTTAVHPQSPFYPHATYYNYFVIVMYYLYNLKPYIHEINHEHVIIVIHTKSKLSGFGMDLNKLQSFIYTGCSFENFTHQLQDFFSVRQIFEKREWNQLNWGT